MVSPPSFTLPPSGSQLCQHSSKSEQSGSPAQALVATQHAPCKHVSQEALFVDVVSVHAGATAVSGVEASGGSTTTVDESTCSTGAASNESNSVVVLTGVASLHAHSSKAQERMRDLIVHPRSRRFVAKPSRSAPVGGRSSGSASCSLATPRATSGSHSRVQCPHWLLPKTCLPHHSP
jgi:hypothetical protein